MKKLILAFFGIFLMLSLCSCASLNLSEFEFRLKDDGTYIVDPGPLFDYKESLVIPESHNGIPVTEKDS